MEKLESDLVVTKRKIDQQDDYALPRIEKQLKMVESDLGTLLNQKQ